MKHTKQIQTLIHMALKEDIGSGDITTKNISRRRVCMCGHIVAREKGIVCGVDIVKAVFKFIDKNVRVTIVKRDGRRIKKGDRVIRLNGPAHSILQGERVALNFISHLSGISTLTHRFVEQVRGTKAKIYDTRKTTPGFRLLEKYAVSTGGGYNHRMGLYDQVLIKDNHFKILDKQFLRRFTRYINQMKKRIPRRMDIEIEVDTLHLLTRVLPAHPDIILLDNMKRNDLKKAIKMIQDENKKEKVTILSEVSGGITRANVLSIARLGVDRISVGAITHSAPAVDFSLE